MDKSAFLTAARILPTREVTFDFGTVTIRALTKEQATKFKGMKEEDIADVMVKQGTLNDDGSLMFAAGDDLSQLKIGVVKTLCDEITELSGLGDQKKDGQK